MSVCPLESARLRQFRLCWHSHLVGWWPLWSFHWVMKIEAMPVGEAEAPCIRNIEWRSRDRRGFVLSCLSERGRLDESISGSPPRSLPPLQRTGGGRGPRLTRPRGQVRMEHPPGSVSKTRQTRLQMSARENKRILSKRLGSYAFIALHMCLFFLWFWEKLDFWPKMSKLEFFMKLNFILHKNRFSCNSCEFVRKKIVL